MLILREQPHYYHHVQGQVAICYRSGATLWLLQMLGILPEDILNETVWTFMAYYLKCFILLQELHERGYSRTYCVFFPLICS